MHGPFARKPKRIRTAFSPSQLLRLERAFEKNHYVVGAERKQLAGSLSLSETQVNILSYLLWWTVGYQSLYSHPRIPKATCGVASLKTLSFLWACPAKSQECCFVMR